MNNLRYFLQVAWQQALQDADSVTSPGRAAVKLTFIQACDPLKETSCFNGSPCYMIFWPRFPGAEQLSSVAAAKLLQSCPTLCDPIDSSPPGSSTPGILQARILEWVAISFSNACMHAKSLQLCLTLCDPMDSSPPGSSVLRILQAIILDWVAISFSNSIFQNLYKYLHCLESKQSGCLWPNKMPLILGTLKGIAAWIRILLLFHSHVMLPDTL